jgi:hypothetical protein
MPIFEPEFARDERWNPVEVGHGRIAPRAKPGEAARPGEDER